MGQSQIVCPFDIGDVVRFTPSERTRGHYQDIESFGVKIGQEVEVKKIKDDMYLYFADDAGEWPFNEFELVKKK